VEDISILDFYNILEQKRIVLHAVFWDYKAIIWAFPMFWNLRGMEKSPISLIRSPEAVRHLCGKEFQVCGYWFVTLLFPLGHLGKNRGFP